MDKFVLTIRMGNAAMLEPDDVARALTRVAEKVDAGRQSGVIADENGQTVGYYAFENDLA